MTDETRSPEAGPVELRIALPGLPPEAQPGLSDLLANAQARAADPDAPGKGRAAAAALIRGGLEEYGLRVLDVAAAEIAAGRDAMGGDIAAATAQWWDNLNPSERKAVRLCLCRPETALPASPVFGRPPTLQLTPETAALIGYTADEIAAMLAPERDGMLRPPGPVHVVGS